MKLINGSRVAIVGGGPAGSFSALNLLRLSAEARLELEVVIFEGRDFNQPGPGGCNKCAGILSSTLLSNLNDFGLDLPPEVIQAELDTYILYLGERKLLIHPSEPARTILSVYRGSGPRLGSPPYPRSFDGWLLDQALERGAVLQRTRVTRILPGSRPTVTTAAGEQAFDLVVIATGINSRSPLDPAWGYHPPQLEAMWQGEITNPGTSFEHDVHIFYDHPAGLVFGGVTPKGRYANISLLGKDLPSDAITQFLERPGIALTNSAAPPSLCSCRPRIVVGPAVGYFADRMVVVGDAAVTRLYKDGIGTAFATARAAMQTAVRQGISRRDFARGYYPTCHQIDTDNRFGNVIFQLWAFLRRSPFLFNIWKRAVLSEAHLPAQARVHERMMWGVFTGDESYRKILFRLLSQPALRSFVIGMIKIRSKP